MVTIMLNLHGYQETKLIYTGTRTLVYGAIQCSTGKPAIVKVLRNPHPSFNELVHFRNQYVITHHLNSPYIVQPLALEPYGNGYALVMPDLGAIALGEYWQKSSRSLTEFLHIAIQLADALHYLGQQRIIHKDIKPANIIIHPETKQVKLVDFSISTLLTKEEQQQINPNVLEGTLAYISPEQTGRMNRGIDYRTDFYSLGVTFYELLTGHLPFTSDDPMELIHCHIAKMPPLLGNREQGPAISRGAEEIKNTPTPYTLHPTPCTLHPTSQVIANIVLKLMAKNAEDRYQSALGLKHDLERCRQELETTGKITSFQVGEMDRSDRFCIPEKLYGRAREVQALLDAFERVANPPQAWTGENEALPEIEVMLVAGFSGIGKTAVINEVHKPIVKQRGYFIKGKFDQFNRNIPFSAIVQAFRDLMEQLLAESDIEIANWQQKIRKALGVQGRVIIDVIPELERIISPQPPVPELAGSAAQNRFNLLFSNFLRVLATKEHPLVLFLDDLQWADSASLNLLKLLMADSETGYLLILGAYRDNEVFSTHPLMLTLNEIQQQGANINTLTLSPLTQADINHLVADALLCDLDIAAPLSQLIYQKTQGNPFFTTHFLQGLYKDGWITFNPDALYWQCNLSQVRQLALTDNVVEFMVGRLRKLPEVTQEVLKLAACIGNQFDLETLAIACDRAISEVAAHLWTALPEGFVVPQSETYKLFQGGEAKHSESQSFMSSDESIAGMLPPYMAVKYRFLHDRIQQAAYSLIPEPLKQSTHLKIGQKLLDKFAEQDPENRIFELVNQLNYGQHLITDLQQRIHLAQLNFTAGEKAKNSTAYQAAAIYLGVGMQLLGNNGWDCDYILTRNLYTLATEVAYLNGDFAEMEMLARFVLRHGQTLLDKITVYETLIVAHIVQNQQLLAVKTALSVLQQLGISLPEQPTTADFTQGLESVNQKLQGCPIEDLVNLPLISDRNIAAGMRILASIFSAAYVTVPALVPLIAFKIVNLSIQSGNAPDSAFGYSLHGLILCGVLGDIKSGYAYGKVAHSLLERGQAKGYQAKVREIFATFIQHWQESLHATLPLLMQSYQDGLEEGDLEFSGYSLSNYAYHSLWLGKNLKDLAQEIASHNEALAKINQNVAQTHHKIHWQTLLNLLGEVENPQILVGQVYDATAMQSWHEEKGDLTGLAFLSLCQMFLSYLFGDAPTAATHSTTVIQYLGALIGSSCIGVFHFYDSLVQLANLDPQLTDPPKEILDRVNANQEKIAKWAEYAPMNYQHKFDLVAAEKYRLLGETLKAIEFYDRAIAGAKENRYLPEEALANELAAKFYLAWGKEKVAAGYLTDAYYCYARWGAVAKTQQLEAKYPQLLMPILQKQRLELNHGSLELITQTILSSTKTQTSSSEISDTLDFASLIQAAQALSRVIELNPLLAEICRIILTNSGAEKVVLVIPDRGQWQLRAIAQITSNGTVGTSTATEPLTPESPVPIRLIQYVKNTGKTVLINEGKTQISGIIEGYLLQYQPQSVFCLPLLSQGQLMAILYLENSTTKGVFTLNRQAIIQFLCTQAAISLQNAQLYDRTQQALQELQQAQLQIVQSEKMSALGNLVAGIAHEINNPTGFLEGNIKPAKNYLKDLFYLIDVCLTKCDTQDPDIKMALAEIDLDFVRDDFANLLESMEVGIDRLKNISKSLRIFSRKDREEKTAFNLSDGIDSTLLILQHRTKANQDRPEIKIVKNYQIIPEIKCFSGQLNQVFMNILANAIDAFDEKNQGRTYAEIKAHPNQIEISLLPLPNDRVKIQIQDNAGGMTPETLNRIFEQGFTTKKVGKGTGLGMAIAHQIITEKHGGTIECESTLGEGSTFTIAIPQ